MKIAIFGGGSIGTRHAQNIIALGVPLDNLTVFDTAAEPQCSGVIPEIRVIDALDRDNAHISRWGEFDAGIICTPASMHAVTIHRAITYRRPFFVEKPATLGTHELTEAEWTTDVPHLVGYNWRFVPAVVEMAETVRGWCANGDSITPVRFEARSDMSTWPGRAYASPLWEMCHEIDLALWMLGRGTVAVARLDAKGVYEIWLSHTGRHQSMLRLDPRSSRFYRGADCLGEFGAIAEYEFRDHAEIVQSYRDEMAHFLRVVRGEEPSCNTLAQAREVVAICEQAEAMVRA